MSSGTGSEHQHLNDNACDCGGGIETCTELGRIPVFGICVLCHLEWMVRLIDGKRQTERRA